MHGHKNDLGGLDNQDSGCPLFISIPFPKAEIAKALAIDGQTMKNAIDEAGHQTPIMSVVGHDSKICHTQHTWVPGP